MTTIETTVMETGVALEIVHAMADQLFKTYGIIIAPATCPHDVQTALDTVEDLIVNNFGEE